MYVLGLTLDPGKLGQLEGWAQMASSLFPNGLKTSIHQDKTSQST